MVSDLKLLVIDSEEGISSPWLENTPWNMTIANNYGDGILLAHAEYFDAILYTQGCNESLFACYENDIKILRNSFPTVLLLVGLANDKTLLSQETISIINYILIKPFYEDQIEKSLNHLYLQLQNAKAIHTRDAFYHSYKEIVQKSHLVFHLNKNFQIIFLNDAFLLFLNANQHSLINKELDAIIDMKYSITNYFELHRALNQGLTWDGELVCRTDSGQQKYINASIHPLVNVENSDVHFIAICYDTTLIRLKENEFEDIIQKKLSIIHQQEAELLTQNKFAMMGEMIANIAHQWRQPLQTISLILMEMDLDIDEDTINTASISNNIHQITSQVKHLSQTIDNFRDFTSENKSKDTFDPMREIYKALSLTSAALKHENITASIYYEGDKFNFYHNYLEDKIILGYKGEFIQVFLNIIANARDAFQDKNTSNRMILINLYKEDKYIIIEISDNAGGIKEEVLEKIFNPYFTTKHQDKGTGLGLYMSKNIIEKHHHGKLSAKNIENGANFTIALPMSYPRKEHI